MSIKLNAQSGGSVALDAPTQTTSSADNVYKLPVADGTAGQVLMTDGSGNLSWTTPSKILQVKQTVKTDSFTNTNTSSHVDVTGLSVSITPSSATSKILVQLSIISGHSSHTTVMGFQLVRDTTAICIGDADGNRTRYTTGMHTHYSNASNTVRTHSQSFLDSPNTTNAITYKVNMRNTGGTAYVNRSHEDLNQSGHGRGTSSITVMEVAA